MDEIGVGIIGAGGIAATGHLPQIADTDGLRVVHLAGRRESRLRTLADRFDVPRWSQDWRSLLDDDAVHAVIVALPHPLHVPAALQALEAGRHVLIEKPLCADMAEADALVAAADARPDQVVYCRPSFGPEVWTLRRLAADGAIGRISGAAARHSHGGPEVYYAEVADAFGEPRPADDLWFFDKNRASVGALFDMGVYAVAQLVAVLGRAQAVSARLTTVAKPTELDDTASLIIEFDHGALATAETGWCDPARTTFLRVHGTEGKLWFPAAEPHTLDRIRPGSAVRENAPPIVDHPALDPAEGQHAEWRRCIRERRQPTLSHPHAARHVTEILLAAQTASQQGRQVRLTTHPTP